MKKGFLGFPNDLFDRWRNILGQNSIERVPLPEPEPRLNVRTGAFFDSIAALPTPHLVPCNPGDVDSPYEVAVTRPAEEGLPQEERRAVLGLSAPTSVAPPLPVQTAESSCSEDEDEDEDEDDDEPALLGYPPIKPIHPVARGRGRLPRSRHLFARPDRPWVRLVRPRHVIRDAEPEIRGRRVRRQLQSRDTEDRSRCTGLTPSSHPAALRRPSDLRLAASRTRCTRQKPSTLRGLTTTQSFMCYLHE
ncbi:coiled-coil domain-containing protein 96-like isoform X3 [Bacillus rossius redtenbacheri]|uniref:coiled-coil domain-containing protein 96-like isoform X3 n=1 Tax=Bacillus rossius redtenbacheri TaxID=93214 RepID=UPI002FDD90B5